MVAVIPFHFQTPVSTITISYPAIGLAPSGYPRIHAEMAPRDVVHLVGYDPRSVMVKVGAKKAGGTPKRAKDTVPHNINPAIVALHNQVQRSIDKERVARMVEYLVGAMQHGRFADWGPIELATTQMPDTSRLATAHTVDMPYATDYFITDGQHRYAALLDFVRDYPQYADKFTQSVTISVFPEEKLVEWSGQKFHDHNYFSVPVRAGKALAVDTREPVNALTKHLANHPTVEEAGGIAYERDTLLTGDIRFTTHSVFHRFVKGFLFGRGGLERDADTADIPVNAEGNITEYLTFLGEVLPWSLMQEDRDAYLTRASVVLSALAVIGHDIYSRPGTPEVRAALVAGLSRVNWRRSNLALVGIVGTEKNGLVQPASSRQAIDATIRYMREVLGLPLPGATPPPAAVPGH